MIGTKHPNALRGLTAGSSGWVIVAALAWVAAPHAAMAQAAATSPAGDNSPPNQLAEVVVTAQKRVENLQSIPVAVTALNSAEIENLQVQNFNNLGGLAPNLTAINSGSGSNPIVTLRGIVGGNVEPGRDNGVAMYLDGVYISRSTGAQFDVADLDRIEVLRGPQGTLYGRNSTGGAINYITTPPRGRLYVRQEVSVGDLGLVRSKTRIDLPKFHDFSISASFLHDQRDGWVANTQAGRVWNFSQLPGGFLTGDRTSADRLGSRNSEAALLAVRYAPQSLPVTVDYKFDWTHARYSNAPKQVLLDTVTNLPRNIPATTQRLGAIPMGFTTPEELNVFGHNLTVSVDLSEQLHFKSITGYRGFRDEYTADTAGGGFENLTVAPGRSYLELVGIVDYERDRTFSQEAQLSYRSKLVEAIGGLYYFEQHTRTLNPLFTFQFLNPPNLPRPALTTDADNHNRSIAAFGQATVHVTPELDVTAGVRGTKDRRESETTLTVTPQFLAHYKHVDWTANLTYRPTQGATLYAKAGTGYLTGGIFNQKAFLPEKLLQYEAGAKTDWLDRRLRVNVAAFHSDYTDLQQSENNPNPPFLYQTFNVGKARINGVELEIAALPVDGLTLTANYGLTDFKYLEFLDPTFGDITNIASPTYDRPRHNINFSAEYQFPEISGGMRPSINFNARWHSDQALYFLSSSYRMTLAHFPATAVAQGALVDAFVNQNAFWNIDVRATLAEIPMGATRGKLSIWMRNALNEQPINNAAIIAPGLVNGVFNEPRTYGADFAVEF